MSECPSTGINKALLKFAPQGRKNLKMYRSKVQHFLAILCGSSYRSASRSAAFLSAFAAFYGLEQQIRALDVARCRRSSLLTRLGKKIRPFFFALIFSFINSRRHFLFIQTLSLSRALYSFHLTRFY